MNATSTDKIAIPTDAILWHDGLLLAPVHFERLTQRHEELVTYHVRSGFQYAWGVRRLQLDKLADRNVSIASVEAVMPDGLLVTHGNGDPALQLALSDATMEALRKPNGRCIVYLALPSGAQAGGRTRLREVKESAAEVSKVRPNVRLVTDADLSAAAEVHLPLLVLKVQNQQLRLDAFLPPLLDIDLAPLDGQPSLSSRARLLLQRLCETERHLAAKAAAREQDMRRLELRMQLQSVCCGIPQLAGTLSLESATPLQLYMALCNVLGGLAFLRDLAGPVREMPAYNHLDPLKTFDTLLEEIKIRLGAIERRSIECAFDLNGGRFCLPLDEVMREGWPLRLRTTGVEDGKRRILLVGVRGLSPEVAQRWLESATIVSAGKREDVRERRVLGAARYGIDSDGALVRLQADGSSISAAYRQEYAIDPEDLLTADTCLFGIERDDELISVGEDLLLEPAGGEMPTEVVLLLSAERAK